jgi:sec-independent protein translocase protein TatB
VPFLSPAKVLVILVVALIVLGPDKLPKVARQIGGLWGDFQRFRERLESDVRGSFPDLPSTESIAQAVRSPLSFLDNLADSHLGGAPSAENGTTSETANGSEVPAVHGDPLPPSTGTAGESPPIPGTLIADPGRIVHQVRSTGGIVPDDPGMN